MKLQSREYKMLLSDTSSIKPEDALDEFLRPLHSISNGKLRGYPLNIIKRRKVYFLDTENRQLHRRGLILRHRLEGKTAQLTLKQRHPDRFIAEKGHDLHASFKAKECFEEDIGYPFISRFSHSVTGTFSQKGYRHPANIEQLGFAFPELELDGQAKLWCVGPGEIDETVYTGPHFAVGDRRASLALILWRLRPEVWPESRGHFALAELSFRYSLTNGKCSTKTAVQACQLFAELGRHLTSDHQTTKTQFVYDFK